MFTTSLSLLDLYRDYFEAYGGPPKYLYCNMDHAMEINNLFSYIPEKGAIQFPFGVVYLKYDPNVETPELGP